MKWKYRVVGLGETWQAQQDQLNEAGAAGWELVCVEGERAYLSRQVFDEGGCIRLVERAEPETLAGLATAACCGGCGTTGYGC